MSLLSDLEKIKDKAEAVYQQLSAEQKEALLRWEKAVDDYNKAKVETFDDKLVDEAHVLGINPQNFDSNSQLRQAIEHFKSELPKAQ